MRFCMTGLAIMQTPKSRGGVVHVGQEYIPIQMSFSRAGRWVFSGAAADLDPTVYRPGFDIYQCVGLPFTAMDDDSDRTILDARQTDKALLEEILRQVCISVRYLDKATISRTVTPIPFHLNTDLAEARAIAGALRETRMGQDCWAIYLLWTFQAAPNADLDPNWELTLPMATGEHEPPPGNEQFVDNTNYDGAGTTPGDGVVVIRCEGMSDVNLPWGSDDPRTTLGPGDSGRDWPPRRRASNGPIVARSVLLTFGAGYPCGGIMDWPPMDDRHCSELLRRRIRRTAQPNANAERQ